MFFTSTLVPSVSVPTGRIDTFASTRIEPSSIFTSETPIDWRMPRSSLTYARACSALRMSGWLTISMSGTPARL